MRRLITLFAVALFALAAAGAHARVGEQTTVCAGPHLEAGSPDECGGTSKPGTLTAGRRVVFTLFCLESPGETCTGMVEVPVMEPLGEYCHRACAGRLHPNKRFLFSVPAGTAGKQVSFGISRHQAKVLGGFITMFVDVYAYQPDGTLACSVQDQLLVRKAKKKKGTKAAAAALPTPDMRCPIAYG